jgi:hypothetical protein
MAIKTQVMDGVSEYEEGLPVLISTEYDKSGSICIVAKNEGGNNHTVVDLKQLFLWVERNHPELIS